MTKRTSLLKDRDLAGLGSLHRNAEGPRLKPLLDFSFEDFEPDRRPASTGIETMAAARSGRGGTGYRVRPTVN